MIQEEFRETKLNEFILDDTPRAIRDRYAALVEKAQNGYYGELDNVVVIDTETTGISFAHDQLTQIAAARLVNGEITDWYVSFVNPGKPIPENIAHLTNIHDEDVCDAPKPSDACAELAEFVGDSPLVAHNAKFDYTFCTKYAGGEPLKNNIWIDSLDLTRIALPRLRSHRLIDLVQSFGAPESTHRADDDVRALCFVYRILLAAVESLPESLIAYISQLATKEEWPTVAVFEYFARKNENYSGEILLKDEKVSDEDSLKQSSFFVPQEKEYLAQTFNLKEMRKQSLSQIKFSSRRDAEAIVQDPDSSLQYPTADEIAEAFSKDGIIGSLYENYEQRDEQLAMSQAVRDAYEKSNNLVVEAGTGVGKSMAYLVPSALLAQKNDITIGIATKTNALLDQLIHKELPNLSTSLKKVTGKELTYAPLKGFAHYPCLRSVNRLVKNGAEMVDVYGETISQAPALAALLTFIEQSEYDDIDSMKIDYRAIPRSKFTISSHECLRSKCPFYGKLCFVHGARRKAEHSDIVVTNHALLFCDIAADGGLLPPIRYWIIDEAHGAEQEARRALSPEISADAILRLNKRLEFTSKQNVFNKAQLAAARSNDNSTLIAGLSAKAQADGQLFVDSAQEFVLHIKDLLYFDTQKKTKGYDRIELWLNDQVRNSEVFLKLSSYAQDLINKTEKVIKSAQELVVSLDDISEAAVSQRELSTIIYELKALVNALDLIFLNPSAAYAYAATLFKKKDKHYDTLQALMINVGHALDEKFYANTHSVVYASATLAIADSFETFENSLGLNTSEFSSCEKLMLPSSYDFDNQMIVYVVNDIPEPNSPGYIEALENLLLRLHIAQQGSMLTLFTNRKEMETCHRYVQEGLQETDLRVVCQKWGVSVKGLRDDFLQDEHLSLMALKSFWEGFDAPGATLRGVVIPKLPFSRPTDPLSCERAERDSQAWMHFVLPKAVIEVKQAAGRLIRKKDDYGSFILTDKRLLTKNYGKAFLQSLPSKTIRVVSSDELVESIESYTNFKFNK